MRSKNFQRVLSEISKETDRYVHLSADLCNRTDGAAGVLIDYSMFQIIEMERELQISIIKILTEDENERNSIMQMRLSEIAKMEIELGRFLIEIK